MLRILGFALSATFVLFTHALWADEANCQWQDQLVCACENANISLDDPKWRACFLGDVNYATTTQVDPLSSRAFSALNWPVTVDENGQAIIGVPDLDADRQGDWTPVWATWKSTRQIFRGGQPPLGWDDLQSAVPAACSELILDAEMAKVAYADTISRAVPPRLLNEYLNPEGHALLDAAGQPVRYDIIFNRQAYQYVVENKLWDPRSLEQYISANGKLDMPMGSWDQGADNPARRGAIALKTSWKILTDADDPERFHKQWAYITPVISEGRRIHDCQLKPVALVGMHIVYKTETMPEWAWGTFEHVDVAPTWDQIGDTNAGITPSGEKVPDWLFFKKNHSGAAQINVAPKSALVGKPSRIAKAYEPGYYFGPVGAKGYSATPCGPANQEFHCINKLMWDFFSGSVFENYHLIGTQWRQGGAYDGLLIPQILANSTMESYSQTTSSCIGCHSYAGPSDEAGKKRVYDFLFTFERDVNTLSVPVQGN
ncbi:hypothetical protein [Shimia aestuarii]|uniref:Cytochrome c domain-containing protein n=1 Tax=Shimia aestuarii TaxID=254406 RepID=A0A1I4PWZ4_9RHOB|nr:hypothetical protein [Shimia aestuarii]SFM32348.1 hypothetical protein SAMN04488042_10684 [Shimia aestuarii]